MTREEGIKSLLAKGPYALVGAGALGKMTLDMWPEGDERPRFFVDSKKSGEYCGLPVYRLGEGKLPAATFLMSAFKMPAEIARAIFEKLGQPELLTVYDYFEEKIPFEFSNGWRNLNPTDETWEKAAAVREAYADDLSKLIHDCACDWRYKRELRADYPVTLEENKYNLSLLGRRAAHYDLVIDVGSFNLSTLGMLTEGGITFDRVVAFEADPKRYAACVDIAAGMQDVSVTIHPHAVADFDGEADFLATSILSSRLAAPQIAGDRRLVSVPVTTLDAMEDELFGDAAPGTRKVLLKLHIEGAELAALKGAEKLLSAGGVDVLLNLSHDEPSLLDLPKYLQSFGHYDISLRSHALYGEGLTLFARYKDAP